MNDKKDIINHIECPLTHPETPRLASAPRRRYRSIGSARAGSQRCFDRQCTRTRNQ